MLRKGEQFLLNYWYLLFIDVFLSFRNVSLQDPDNYETELKYFFTATGIADLLVISIKKTKIKEINH